MKRSSGATRTYFPAPLDAFFSLLRRLREARMAPFEQSTLADRMEQACREGTPQVDLHSDALTRSIREGLGIS